MQKENMNQQSNLNRFHYQLIEEKSVNDKIQKSIEINQENTILLISTEMTTNIYIFKQGFIKLLTQFNGHKSDVTSLKFLNKKSRFLSGSLDQSISIWSTQLLANPKFIQKVKDHQNPIVALVIHPNIENIFISASYEQILFYSYTSQKQWSCVQQITEIESILGLSINLIGTKIVLCCENFLIVVLELLQLKQQQQSDQTWIVKQKIKVREWGLRSCFLDNDTFVFQPTSKVWIHNLDIYTLNKLNEYQKKRTIPIKGVGLSCINNMPFLFNKEKCILFVQYGNCLHLCKYIDRKFTLQQEQAISFHDPTRTKYGTINGIIYGTISKDGEYLITWNTKCRQIQIRKYTEINQIQTIE